MNLEKRLAALERAQAGSICHDPTPLPLRLLSIPELRELRDLIQRARALDPSATDADAVRYLPEGEQDRIAELLRKARGEETR